LFDKAIHRDSTVIAQHPHLLLQFLWHTCYWHDCPEAKDHYQWKKPEDADDPSHPWNQPGEKLCDLLKEWVAAWRISPGSTPLLRSRRPSGAPLQSGLLAILRGHEHMVWSVSISADGKRIASGSWDNTVRVWEADTGREIAVLRGHEGLVRSVSISADGKRIVSGSDDRTVRVWEADTGREIAVLRGHEDSVGSVSITADGKRIASGSWDNTVRVWEADTGWEIVVLRGHEWEVRSVSISADGKRIVSGSYDKTVRVWEADTGREIAVLRGHQTGVRSVSISGDEREIISQDWNGRILRWNIGATAQPEGVPQGSDIRGSSLDVLWPGGEVTLSQSGEYAAVFEGIHVIPCKVERSGF